MSREGSQNGIITVPGSNPPIKIPTTELVRQIRAYRGKYTFRQILVKLNWPHSGDDQNSRWGWLTIRRLCKEYEISTADPPEEDRENFRRSKAADRREEKRIVSKEVQDAIDFIKRQRRNKKIAERQAAKDLKRTNANYKKSDYLARLAKAAKQQLMREIKAAKKEAKNAPKYKPGPLEW